MNSFDNNDEDDLSKYSCRRKVSKKRKDNQNKKVSYEFKNLTFSSKNIDNQLYHIVGAIEVYLVEMERLINIDIEESRHKNTFVYYFENNDLGLSGYIGRDKKTHQVIYVVKDHARFKWARLEGFLDKDEDSDIVYERIGVFRKVRSINDFIAFIAGKKTYRFSGTYLTTN